MLKWKLWLSGHLYKLLKIIEKITKGWNIAQKETVWSACTDSQDWLPALVIKIESLKEINSSVIITQFESLVKTLLKPFVYSFHRSCRSHTLQSTGLTYFNNVRHKLQAHHMADSIASLLIVSCEGELVF